MRSAEGTSEVGGVQLASRSVTYRATTSALWIKHDQTTSAEPNDADPPLIPLGAHLAPLAPELRVLTELSGFQCRTTTASMRCLTRELPKRTPSLASPRPGSSVSERPPSFMKQSPTKDCFYRHGWYEKSLQGPFFPSQS